MTEPIQTPDKACCVLHAACCLWTLLGFPVLSLFFLVLFAGFTLFFNCFLLVFLVFPSEKGAQKTPVGAYQKMPRKAPNLAVSCPFLIQINKAIAAGSAGAGS